VTGLGRLRLGCLDVAAEAARSRPWVDGLVRRFGPSARSVPRTVRRRVTSVERLARRQQGDVRWTGPPEQVTVELALRSSPGAGLVRRTTTFSQPRVVDVGPAMLIGRHATCVLDSGLVVLTGHRGDVSMLGAEWASEPLELDRERLRLLPGTPWREPLVSFVNRLDSNIYHWLTESCAQVEYLRASGYDGSVLVRDGSPEFVTASLAMLGIDKASLRRWPVSWDRMRGDDARLGAQVSNLVCASPVGSPKFPSVHSLRWLREEFRAGCGADESGDVRLYVDRDGWRSVRNREEVHTCVRARGFRIVEPSTLGFANQVQLFSQARVIVGPHGAGLTNALFAENAEVVELRGSYGGQDFRVMSQALGHRYRALECAEDNDLCLHVDIRALETALEGVSR